MTQTQSTVAEPKKAPLQMADTTYFVLINDDHERKAAKAYLSSLYPGTEARVVSDLRLDRLTDKHTVIALYRNDDRTVAVALRHNAQGIREPVATPLDVLMREVHESRPVACAAYWQKSREGNEGELDLAGFMEELGKVCTPAVIKFYPRDGLLRLAFA